MMYCSGVLRHKGEYLGCGISSWTQRCWGGHVAFVCVCVCVGVMLQGNRLCFEVFLQYYNQKYIPHQSNLSSLCF